VADDYPRAHPGQHRRVVALVRSRGTARTTQNQELSALSRDKASTLMFSARWCQAANGLDGRFLVVFDGTGGARYRSSPVRRAALRAPRARIPSTRPEVMILAWFAAVANGAAH
jgi:hypothetical protein